MELQHAVMAVAAFLGSYLGQKHEVRAVVDSAMRAVRADVEQLQLYGRRLVREVVALRGRVRHLEEAQRRE